MDLTISQSERSDARLARHAGLGAMAHGDGVAFRVWAPNAELVSVVGSFNDWDAGRHVCEAEDGGTWYVDVAEARPGDEYRYLIVNDDQELSRIDPRAREVTNSVGNGVIPTDEFDWQGDDFALAPWNELVLYEMHIGTFNRHDQNPVGTFDTAMEKLPYLAELGINAIELMPLVEFAGDLSWGYNPAHPFAIESAYGGPEGLKRFVREAHKLGIGVICDVVYNHFGPSDLHLWQFDGWSENGKGGIYFYNDDRAATPWGDTRPDYRRGEVRQYIFDNAMMWLADYHADGLRYDMTLYMRSVDGSENRMLPEGFSLVQWINREIGARFPGRIVIAEDMRNNSALTADEGIGGANFSAQWDADFVHSVRRLLTQIDDANRSMAELRDLLTHRYNLDVFERVIYTESHDEVANGKQRVVSEIDPSDDPGRYAIKRATLGAALVLTAPGIPMLMQGQEFLRDKHFDDARAIDWQRAEDRVGVVAMHRDLIALRRNLEGKTLGLTGQNVDPYHVNDNDKVIAFRRWREGGPGDDVVVVMAFSEHRKVGYRIGLPSAGTWHVQFNGDWSGYHQLFDDTRIETIEASDDGSDGQPVSAQIDLGAYSSVILSQ